jgi:hypothetical protein
MDRDPWHAPERVSDVLLWLPARVGGKHRADDMPSTIDKEQRLHEDENPGRADFTG